MTGQRVTGTGRLRRSAVVVAGLAVVSAAVLPGGTASAARQRGGSAAQAPAAGTISTVAGGIGGPGKGTGVSIGACGVAYSASRVYVAGGSAVRTVNPKGDWLTTVAGTGNEVAPLGDGGLAVKATLAAPCGIAVGQAGNLLVADPGDQRVRLVAHTTGTFFGRPMKAGYIYTVAGDGTIGASGDGGPATKAQLDLTEPANGQLNPAGVAVDGAGNLVIADSGSNRIRVVAASAGTFYGQAMKAGYIYAVAGDGTPGFAGDGGPAVQAELSGPGGVAVDASGNLVIADTNSEKIRVVAEQTGTFYGQAMTTGDIYTVAGDGTQGFAGDGGPATSAELNTPLVVTSDPAGNLVFSDYGNVRVRVVAEKSGTFYGQAMTAGNVYTVAGNGTQGFGGNGGPATSAELFGVYGVAVDGSGNLLLADIGQIRVIPSTSGTYYGQAMTAGNIYDGAGNSYFVLPDEQGGFSGDGGPATRAVFFGAGGVAVDSAGNLAVIDTDNLRIRLVAAHTGTLFGQAMTAGDVYTVAGDGGDGFSGDGQLATGAEFNFPGGVTADSAGNLVIADSGNSRIRVVAASTGKFYGHAMKAGYVYSVAGDGLQGSTANNIPASQARLFNPESVAVDSAGNLVIGDTGIDQIRVVAEKTGTFYGQAMAAGNIYTIAGNGNQGLSGNGGPATKAELDQPRDAVLDGAGNVVIADTGNNEIRVVADQTGTFYGVPMTAHDIYTVAGIGAAGFSGDGGAATRAALSDPSGVAVDGGGNLAVADEGNDRVRVVADQTGTFYGVPMTAHDIYTVAGTGAYGFSGDGGPAKRAHLSYPDGLTVDGANLLIADGSNNRIRQVTG